MNRRIVVLIFSVVFFNTNLYSQSYSVDTIQYNGDPNKIINFVLIGDGYQANQLNAYITDAVNLSNYLFSVSPFLEYKDYFNVFAINVPSVDSGANHPGTSPDASCPSVPLSSVNTCCNSTFDYANIHRLLVPQNYSAINNILINNFPLYDQTIILVNSPYYGGSGGGNATTSLHPAAPEILVHEIGHSFSGLADEYWAGDQYAAEKPNLTQETNPLLVKWKNWIGTNGIGIYQHSGTTIASTWYRPHNTCKMRSLSNDFCAVCKETIIKTIHNVVGSPILISYPPQSNIVYTNPLQFKLTLLKPNPNTLRVKWNLNGSQIANNIDSITLIASNLIIGSNVLSAEVIDTTQLSRFDDHPIYHTYNVSWSIQYFPVSVYEIGLTSFKIYPNPSKGVFNIILISENKKSIEFKLVNSLGKILFTNRLEDFSGEYTDSFNLGAYSKGSYLLQIHTDEGIVNKKLILE